MTKFVLDWVENIVGKRENTGYQHIILFPQCFQNPTLLKGVSKQPVPRSYQKECVTSTGATAG